MLNCWAVGCCSSMDSSTHFALGPPAVRECVCVSDLEWARSSCQGLAIGTVPVGGIFDCAFTVELAEGSQCLPDTARLGGFNGSSSKSRLPVPLMEVMGEKTILQYNRIQIWQRYFLKRCAGDQGAFVPMPCLPSKLTAASCATWQQFQCQEPARMPLAEFGNRAGNSLFLGDHTASFFFLCNYCPGD